VVKDRNSVRTKYCWSGQQLFDESFQFQIRFRYQNCFFLTLNNTKLLKQTKKPNPFVICLSGKDIMSHINGVLAFTNKLRDWQTHARTPYNQYNTLILTSVLCQSKSELECYSSCEKNCYQPNRETKGRRKDLCLLGCSVFWKFSIFFSASIFPM
jgi:hypothetical protein